MTAERRRRATGRPNLSGWLFVVGVTLLAELAVRRLDLYDSVAAPSQALRALASELWSGSLAGELGTTLEAYLQGLALAIVAGVVGGVLLGGSRFLHDASFVVVEFLRPIPAVALIPLAILFFGFDVPMRRWLVAYAAVWPILIATLYGVRGVDRLLYDVARTCGTRRLAMLARVTLPAALPSITSGIRISASIALLVAVTAELVTGTNGIGAYMQLQQNAFRLPELYAAIILVGVVGYAVNAALRTAERRAVFWSGEERLRSR